MRRDEATINRDQIVLAALEIVDEGGNGELSMRAVAARVDRHVSSLYNHVANRAELVELLSAHIVNGIDVSDFEVSSWDVAIAEWSRSYVAAFLAHPNMVQILATAPVRDAPTLLMYESIMRSLVSQGWPLREAVYAIRMVEAHAWGSVFDIVAPDPDFALYESDPNLTMVSQMLASGSAHDYGARASYEAGLVILVEGLRTRHAAVAVRASSPRG